MDAWEEDLFGLQEAKNLHSWSPGSKCGREGKSPISPSRRGANPLWASTNNLLPNQSSHAHVHTSAVFSPMAVSPSLLWFFAWLLLYILARGWGQKAHLDSEWICCNSLRPGASLSCSWALLLLRICSGTEILLLLFLQHLFGVLLYSRTDGVLAKPFVGAVFHCQAEPSSAPINLLITERSASVYSSPLSRTTTVFGHKTCGEQIHLFICALRTTGIFCTTARIHGSKKLKDIWKKGLDFEAFPSFLKEVALG